MADTVTTPAVQEEPQEQKAAEPVSASVAAVETATATESPRNTKPVDAAQTAAEPGSTQNNAKTDSKTTQGPSKTLRTTRTVGSASTVRGSTSSTASTAANAEGDNRPSRSGSFRSSRDSRDSRDSRNRSSDNMSSSQSRRSHSSQPQGNLQPISGFIDTTPDGHAVVRRGWTMRSDDAYLSLAVVRKLGLRPGDWVEGMAREPRENDRYWGMHDITKANGIELSQMPKRRRFEDMVPVYPDSKLVLETGPDTLSTRLIDLIAPIGKGQRGLIVSPPKAGKTTIMKDLATGIATNYPDVHLMAVLIGERPEEVTDIRRHLEKITNGKGEVPASNFDEHASEQTRVSEVALERAKRLVEMGKDVVILLDSITRLARAYNLAMPTSGRTLSGGFDPAALWPPKRFFGAARNFEDGGSLTIIGTALVDTGSRMDDLIYEEFKGTGNQELHLDRRTAERRIYPAINIQKSGTRRDDLLFDNQEYQSILTLQRMVDMLGEEERTPVVLQRLKSTPNNKQFLASLKNG
jgi:transcription termination factor Rho